MGSALAGRRRWYLILIVSAIVVYLFLHKTPTSPSPGGWNVYGVPGQFLGRSAASELASVAPFVPKVPQQLGGLSYAGAIVHPEGLSGVSFVELLYGRPKSNFFDVSESTNALAVSGRKTAVDAAGIIFHIGRATISGRRLSFAVGGTAVAHLLVVTPIQNPNWQSILPALIR